MKTYRIEKTSDPNWSQVDVAYIDKFPWPRLSQPFSMAQMVWTEQGLQVRMQTDEKPRFMKMRGFAENVYTENCMELFLMPDPKNDRRYYNWEFNPAGAILHSLGADRYNREMLYPRSWEKLFRIETDIAPWGWRLSFYIPFEYIKEHFPQLDVREGVEMRGNFFKIADGTDAPHYGCWTYIEADNPDFHIPEFFGKMVFGGEG